MSSLQQRRSALRALKADLKQVQALLDKSEALRSFDLSDITQKVNEVTTEISRAVAQPHYRHPGQQEEQDDKGPGKFQSWGKKNSSDDSKPRNDSSKFASSVLSGLPLMAPVTAPATKNGPIELKTKGPSSQPAFLPAPSRRQQEADDDDDDDMELDEPAPNRPMARAPIGFQTPTGVPQMQSMAGMRPPGGMEPSGALGALAAMNGSFGPCGAQQQMHGMWQQSAMGMGLGGMGAGMLQSMGRPPLQPQLGGLQAGMQVSGGGLLGSLESALAAANASAGLAGNYGVPGQAPHTVQPPGGLKPLPDPGLPPGARDGGAPAAFDPAELAARLAAGAGPSEIATHLAAGATSHAAEARTKPAETPSASPRTMPPLPPSFPSVAASAPAASSSSPPAAPAPTLQSPPPPPPEDTVARPSTVPAISAVPAIPSFPTKLAAPSPASLQAQTAQAQSVAAAALLVQQQAAASKEAASRLPKAQPAFKGASVMGRPPVGQPAQPMSFGAFGRPRPPVRSDALAQAFPSDGKSLADVFSAEAEQNDIAPPAPPDRRGALAPVKDSNRSLAEERDSSSVKPWWQMPDSKGGRSRSGGRRTKQSRSRSRRRPSPRQVSRKGGNFDSGANASTRSRSRKKDKKDKGEKRDRSRSRNRKKRESRSASRKMKRAERSWSRGRGRNAGGGGGGGGGGGVDTGGEFFQPQPSRSQSGFAELTVEISEGITERTSRLGLKKKMQVFGDVEVCHMGNRAIDKPFVRFKTSAHADAAVLGLQNGEVFLDGMVLRGKKKSDYGGPSGGSFGAPEQATAVQDMNAGGRQMGGKRSPSNDGRRRRRSPSNDGRRRSNVDAIMPAAEKAPFAGATSALAVPTPKAVPPAVPGGVAVSAVPDWLSDLVPAPSSGRMLRPREVMIPQQFVARLIGRGGEVIMAICNATGADVKIRQETKEMGYSLAVISGSEQAMNLGEQMVRQRLMMGGP